MSDHLQKLEEAKKLRDEGVLTQEEFEREKQKILKEVDTPDRPTQATQVIVNNNSGCGKTIMWLIIGFIILVIIGQLVKTTP